jgi:hypothetical protein
MGPKLWSLVAFGDSVVATQAVLAAAIQHSRLLGDFLLSVVGERWLAADRRITTSDWEDYLQNCCGRDGAVSQWSEVTCRKCRGVIFLTLMQAGYIEGSQNRRLQSVHVVREVHDLLEGSRMAYVLRCMQVTS